MPRMRPLRKLEDIKNVPEDKPVLIDIGGNNEEEISTKQEDQEQEKLRLEAEAAAARAEAAEREKDEVDEEKTGLLKQLADMKKAVEESRQQALEADKQRQEAARRAAEHEKASRRYEDRASQAEYEAVLTAIGTAEAEGDAAARDLEHAVAESDTKGMVDAQRRMSRAESRKAQLEDGKAQMEAAAAIAKERAKAAPEQERPTLEGYIESMTNLMPSQKTWLKSHPELLTDQRKNTRLGAAHFDAEDKGLVAGTDSYFQFLEERLGYREAQKPVVNDEDEDDEPVQHRRQPLVSAPVSRDTVSTTSGKPSSSKITLSPEQREAARIAGVDEITYARNLQKLNQARANGSYN